MGAPPQDRPRRTRRRAMGCHGIGYVELLAACGSVRGTRSRHAEAALANAFLAPSGQSGRLRIAYCNRAEFDLAGLWRAICAEGFAGGLSGSAMAGGDRDVEKQNLESRGRALHSARAGLHQADAGPGAVYPGSEIFCPIRHSTPVGSTSVKSRMPQGRSSGGPAATLYLDAIPLASM